MKPRLLLALALLAPVCGAQAETYAERWERLANAHLAMVKAEPGKSYEREFIKVHNTFWRKVYQACEGEALRAGVEKFSAVLVLDAQGTVTEFLAMPDKPALACFGKQLLGREYPAPPVTPFYERMNVKLTKRAVPAARSGTVPQPPRPRRLCGRLGHFPSEARRDRIAQAACAGTDDGAAPAFHLQRFGGQSGRVV